MNDRKCENCINRSQCKGGFSSWLFFIIGIISAIAIRITVFLLHLNPVYSKISWYVGVGGFFVFFVYKFKILQETADMIKRRHILEKLETQKQLNSDDYNLIQRVLCSLTSKKERINYLFIFGLSAIALSVAVYLDFLNN